MELLIIVILTTKPDTEIEYSNHGTGQIYCNIPSFITKKHFRNLSNQDQYISLLMKSVMFGHQLIAFIPSVNSRLQYRGDINLICT